MQIAMIRCLSCTSPLDRTVRWARLLIEAPGVFLCTTEWGRARFKFGVPERRAGPTARSGVTRE